MDFSEPLAPPRSEAGHESCGGRGGGGDGTAGIKREIGNLERGKRDNVKHIRSTFVILFSFRAHKNVGAGEIYSLRSQFPSQFSVGQNKNRTKTEGDAFFATKRKLKMKIKARPSMHGMISEIQFLAAP